MINARVNEKLYFAKLALTAAEQAESAMQSALLEAAVFQLFTAYRGYLQEITNTAATAFASASDLASATSPSSNDLEELLNLERTASWLSQLLAAYNRVIAPIVTPPRAATELAVIDVTAQLDTANCRDWLHQLTQLIRRQRDHAQEW